MNITNTEREEIDNIIYEIKQVANWMGVSPEKVMMIIENRLTKNNVTL